MNLLRRSLLGLLIAMGLARLLGYLAYAAASLPSPMEAFHLEAKMVLLANRAELGVTLYPSWRDYPHVSNFFGPVYFGLVGLVGRAFEAEIPDLFAIGRGISFGSGLLTSMILGVVVARRAGARAGLAGALLSLGAAPMFGFSVMVRPDLLAELLGISGFFLAGHKALGGRVAGGLLLALAALTKQTTVVFLMAAVLSSIFEHEWRRGLRLAIGVGGLLLIAVLGVTLAIEPNFASGLTGESKTPWELGSMTRNLTQVWKLAPDLLYFPILGLILWLSGASGVREVRPVVLTAILLASSLGLAAKRGADLNYDLSLRAAEALAVGALWQAWSLSTPGTRLRSGLLAIATLLGGASLIPGVIVAVAQARAGAAKAAFLEGPYGREVLGFYRELERKAVDPDFHLLTDSGLIDLYHGERAVFGDPWLFRMLAETGQLTPTLIRDRIDSGYYDLIVTTSELDRPTYDSYEFGLPKLLADRARVRYVRIGTRAGLFLYGRRPTTSPGPG
ncbi:hypothetical protein P12x_002743 [Tundrisphaera lichenicola]|uniref:hypothetical protein n=1 Tax=Tundrisphaera lichenicola TaxID=2029860 RepID=UPI003EBA5998